MSQDIGEMIFVRNFQKRAKNEQKMIKNGAYYIYLKIDLDNI